MKYRDAKKLSPGDLIINKDDKLVYMVDDIEVYGSIKKVRLYCKVNGEPNKAAILYNEDVELWTSNKVS